MAVLRRSTCYSRLNAKACRCDRGGSVGFSPRGWILVSESTRILCQCYSDIKISSNQFWIHHTMIPFVFEMDVCKWVIGQNLASERGRRDTLEGNPIIRIHENLMSVPFWHQNISWPVLNSSHGDTIFFWNGCIHDCNTVINCIEHSILILRTHINHKQAYSIVIVGVLLLGNSCLVMSITSATE